MEHITETFELYGKTYSLSTGELAKQASGAVKVTQGDTTVLVTAVISDQEKDYDFFPLTVDFIEKMYAVGRIPGGYLKREAKPSDKGILTARMIDRPIRPSFPIRANSSSTPPTMSRRTPISSSPSPAPPTTSPWSKLEPMRSAKRICSLP